MRKRSKRKGIYMQGTKFEETTFTRKSYKNEEAYLRALYKKNKGILVEKGFTYSMFKENIKNIKIEENMTTSQAVRAFGRTRTFMSKEEIEKENFRANTDKDFVKTLKKKAQVKNKRDIDFNQDFTWDKTNKVWIHNNGKFGIQYVETDNSLEEAWWEIIDL